MTVQSLNPRAEDVAECQSCLLTMQMAQGSIPSTTKTKKFEFQDNSTLSKTLSFGRFRWLNYLQADNPKNCADQPRLQNRHCWGTPSQQWGTASSLRRCTSAAAWDKRAVSSGVWKTSLLHRRAGEYFLFWPFQPLWRLLPRVGEGLGSSPCALD